MKRLLLLSAATIAFIWLGAGAGFADAVNDREQAMQVLVDDLTEWIGQNTELESKPFAAGNIEFVEPGDLVIADGEEHWIRHRNRGLYDMTREKIYLRLPWDPANPYDQSILLHELVHHAQTGSRHWYCPKAMEWDAYQIQENWLSRHRIEADFHWASILLESSCQKYDHHPE